MKAAFLPNIRNVNQFEHFEILDILNDIKTGKYKKQIDTLRQSTRYKEDKIKLPAWSFAGSFSKSVSNSGFFESNGLFHFDVDNIDNVEQLKLGLIHSCPELFAVWVSPSGKGLKGLLRIPDDFIHDDADFKKAFIQVKSYFFDWYGVVIDESCKDVRRLCFVCYDPDIFINENAPAFIFDVEKWNYEPEKTINKPSTNHQQNQKNHINKEELYIDWCVNILRRAGKGDYHNARLRAGKLAGGYIQSGVVSETAVINALIQESDSISARYNDSASVIQTERKAILNGIEAGKLSPVAPIEKPFTPTSRANLINYDECPPLPDIEDIAARSNIYDFGTGAPMDYELPDFSTQQSQPMQPKSKFKFITGSELLSREFKTDWLVKGLFEKESMGLVFGNSASGKSMIIQDLAWCVANGLDFKGHETKKQGRVAYVCGEGFKGLMRRFRALMYHYGGDAENLLISEQPAGFMNEESAFDVSEAIKEFGSCELIIIDTFHRNMGGGDENSSKDFSQFLSNLDKYLKPFGATIIIIHHSGHDNKERSRGSSAIRASMDFEFMMTKDEDLGIATLKNTKMKDSEPPKPMSFNFTPVDFNMVDDGVKQFGVVLATNEEHEFSSKKIKPLDRVSQDVFSALCQLIEEKGTIPPKEVKEFFKTTPENTPLKVIHIDDFRPIAYPFFDVEPESKRKTLSRTIAKLKERGKCMLYNDYLWIS